MHATSSLHVDAVVSPRFAHDSLQLPDGPTCSHTQFGSDRQPLCVACRPWQLVTHVPSLPVMHTVAYAAHSVVFSRSQGSMQLYSTVTLPLLFTSPDTTSSHCGSAWHRAFMFGPLYFVWQFGLHAMPVHTHSASCRHTLVDSLLHVRLHLVPSHRQFVSARQLSASEYSSEHVSWQVPAKVQSHVGSFAHSPWVASHWQSFWHWPEALL